ncbi:putative dehydrogenase [Diaminobutyricimonas aerilata]|uniref:Putative dehydrogenase n=1 Tax=Diaminobutyricimonas aerilata TaxID=1162967 RepID=A0A2M9CGF3_9MICO|nr:Gfo/Idh/MocA family oxidoreductase [Diaminobutyricimonas aerilata]PJJ71011.1 putative dehydrogenase [Diaminobutyricimonas aerilata]
MTTRTIRVGLIGAGGIAGAHVNGYLANPDVVTLVAVADPVAENAERRAEAAGAETYSDYLDMIANADIDAVDICLPHHLHKDAIVAAAAAGKHILCEKPLCLTPEEAAEVTEAVERAGVTLMCAHNQLFAPAVAKARELIDAGVIGRVFEVRTTDSFYNDFNPENMGWRATAKTSGGGELIDTGYHPSYLLMHLAGAAPTEVAAMLSTHRLTFMEGEDSAQVLVRFENGVVGTITTSWAYTPTANTERFSAVGELGSLYSDGTTLHYRVRGGETATVELPKGDEFAAEIRHFATSLIGGTRPLHTHVEGIDVLGIILAAYESGRSGAIAPVVRPGALTSAV